MRDAYPTYVDGARLPDKRKRHPANVWARFLQRGDNCLLLNQLRFGFRVTVQLLTLFGDHRFRCAGNEAFVGEFAFDTGNLTFDFRDFFRQTRQLIFFVDETSHRDQQLGAVDDFGHRNRTFVIGRQHGDAFQTRQVQQEALVVVYTTHCIRAATTQ